MHHDFLDKYSAGDSVIHRLDARVKTILTLVLIISCASTPDGLNYSYAVYASIIILAAALGRVPALHIFRRLMLAAPFIAAISLFVFLSEGEGERVILPGGISVYFAKLTLFSSMLIKIITAVSAVTVLSAATGFSDLVTGMRTMKIPAVLVDLLNFFYRYIFVLVDEVERMKRAYDSRNFGKNGWNSIKVLSSMIGVLLLRSFERSERIYRAMQARLYNGGIITANNTQRINLRESAILAAGLVVILAVRLSV